MENEIASQLKIMNGALWTITAFIIIGSAVLCFFLYKLILFMKELTLLIKETKTQVNKISESLNPLISETNKTVKEIRLSLLNITSMTGKLSDGITSLMNIFSYINLFKTAAGKKTGFFSGIMTGLNVFNTFKKLINKK